MRNLAKNLAWMMKCFEAGKVAGVPLPRQREEIRQTLSDDEKQYSKVIKL